MGHRPAGPVICFCLFPVEIVLTEAMLPAHDVVIHFVHKDVNNLVSQVELARPDLLREAVILSRPGGEEHEQQPRRDKDHLPAL